MSLQVEKLEHNMAKLTIEVSAEEVEKALQAAYLKERSKISLPGVRIRSRRTKSVCRDFVKEKFRVR